MTWGKDALDLGDGEAQDEGPDQPEDELPPAVDDVCAPVPSNQPLLPTQRVQAKEQCKEEEGAPSGPMLVKCTPISLIRSSAFAAFSTFCTRRYGW